MWKLHICHKRSQILHTAIKSGVIIIVIHIPSINYMSSIIEVRFPTRRPQHTIILNDEDQ